MTPDDICIGIATQSNSMSIAAIHNGHWHSLQLPNQTASIDLLKRLLRRSRIPVRVAIAGPLALATAIAIADTPVREVVIVTEKTASHSVALACYAGHSL